MPVLVGASLVGILAVASGVDRRTGIVGADAAIGRVVPAPFAIWVVPFTRSPSVVHLFLDRVLFGDIACSQLDRPVPFGTIWGNVRSGCSACWRSSMSGWRRRSSTS